MFTLEFPFGRKVFVCEICGYEAGDRRYLKWCEATGALETTELKALDRVMMGERCVLINELFYTKPGMHIKDIQPPTHTLAAHMWEPFHLSPEEIASGNRNGSHWTMLYSDIVLWQEGDEQKLREAGLIEDPPPPPPTLKKESTFSRWWKGL